GAPHAHGRQQHDDGEGQGAGNRHALQRLEAAGQQQYRGQHTAEDGPAATLPGRCIQCPAGGQGVDHQCPGIRRGDEAQGDQQYRGQHTAEDGPAATVPGRCIQCPAGGQRVDHQCPGSRRGDEEQGGQQYCEEGRHRSEGELLQQLEQGDGVVRLHLINQFAVALVDDQVQCGVTEYREPEEGEDGRYQHHTEDELADSATTADLGDEQAEKGCQGDG